MGLLCFLHHVETLQLPFLFLSQPLEMDTLPMSQQQTLAPLGKLIGYFADYDSVVSPHIPRRERDRRAAHCEPGRAGRVTSRQSCAGRVLGKKKPADVD